MNELPSKPITRLSALLSLGDAGLRSNNATN